MKRGVIHFFSVFKESSIHLEQIKLNISEEAKEKIETKMLTIVRQYLILCNIGLTLPMVLLLPFQEV